MVNDYDITTVVKKLQPELHEAIKTLVAINSEQSEPFRDAPYGIGPKQALDTVLEMAEKLGFETVNLDNKIGYAVLKGTNNQNEYYGIFGHVDCVPLGLGWEHAPLGCDIENNRMYGRGVLDNKGPILANLFALYAVKELGVTFKKDIRIVFGCNEETGMECVKYYNKKEHAPIFGWTPDCKWPVVYGERGRLRVLIQAKDPELLYRFMNEYIFTSFSTGKQLGIQFKDDDFGELLVRGYQLSYEDGVHCLRFSMSYPSTCTAELLMERIQKKLFPEMTMSMLANWDPVLYDKSSKYVQALQKVYNECTGLTAEPVTTTGGTYAKIIPNIIAYGPSFPGQKDIAHLPDEWIDLDDLCLNMEIYARALVALSEVEDDC